MAADDLQAMRVFATRPGFGWRQLAAAVVFAAVVAGGAPVEAAVGAKQKLAAKLFLRGEYQKALELYAELAVSTARPIFRCEIARCHHRLGNYRDARFNLSECLQTAQLTPARRASLEGLMAELNANLDAAPPAESAPEVAEPSPAPPAAVPPPAPPASPEASAAPAAPGAVPSAMPTPPPPARTVVISGSSGSASAQAPASPEPVPAPPAPPPAPPYALSAPAAAAPAPPVAGGASVAPGLYQASSPRPDERGGGWMRPAGYWLGALGLVAAGGGAVAGHFSNQKFEQVEEQYNDARYKNAQRLNLYQLVGYGVGAVSLGTALTFLLLAPDAEDSHAQGASSLSAVVGPTSFSVLGRF